MKRTWLLLLFIGLPGWTPRAVAGSDSPASVLGDRYKKEIFSSVKVNRDLLYGQAVNQATGKNEKLRLDLYEPKGDTEPKRPAIVLIHGGGFTKGDKESQVIVQLAKRFAKRGYVTVSIDYRLSKEFSHSDTTKVYQAVTQAYQDAKAAIRWLRKYAQDYRIDSHRIAVGGVSAGAITALHAAYEEDEGNSGNSGYSSEVAVAISVAGALVYDSIMEAGEAPFIAFHGYLDFIVPYQQALELSQRAKAIGLKYALYSYMAGHDLSPYIEDIVQRTTDFLYQYMIQSGPTSVQQPGAPVPMTLRLHQNYPNPIRLSAGSRITQIAYELSSPGDVTLKLYNVLGQEIATLAQGWHEAGRFRYNLDIRRLPPGLYIYQLRSGNQVLSRKFIISR
ncbi:MAG: alpha/beta hydrolase fold domain-containing protein [candidate division KSB1 bacterium]|nr:alpha/beta hydrolase fold domain-containing protein [candidate division KSB1 bacterium]